MIDEKLNRLIDDVIMELNPELLDDDYPDAYEDWDKRVEAMEYIKEKLQKQLEEK